ncbi:CLUMA_CG006375, isoform A [Clunio marinus]|uniref:CLUMA_CG006375, isoform A n=1 Tax=Clunio marinus TaxID=568069 RepID=A0A1J1HZN8_9DIPT|nr:CLUMA_CG006375, isoform A [Clunio marinus]
MKLKVSCRVMLIKSFVFHRSQKVNRSTDDFLCMQEARHVKNLKFKFQSSTCMVAASSSKSHLKKQVLCHDCHLRGSEECT